MNWLDYIILAVLGVSALVGLLRGFTREALNLGSWILAVAAAIFAGPVAAGWLEGLIALNTARLLVAYLGVFILTLIVGSVVTHFIASAIRGTAFSGPDRVLGSLFGLGRGGLIVVIAATVATLTIIEQEDFWQESALVPYVEPAAAWTRERLPRRWVEEIRPPQEEPGTAQRLRGLAESAEAEPSPDGNGE